MKVEPIEPTLKALGTKRLKLERDEPPSNFAFKFNLRRFVEAWLERKYGTVSLNDAEAAARTDAEVGRCRLTLSNPF